MRLAGLLAIWLTVPLHADTVRPLPDSLAAMDTIGKPISERLALSVNYRNLPFSNPFGDRPLPAALEAIREVHAPKIADTAADEGNMDEE